FRHFLANKRKEARMTRSLPLAGVVVLASTLSYPVASGGAKAAGSLDEGRNYDRRIAYNQGFQAVPDAPVAVPAALSGGPELRTTRDDAFGTAPTSARRTPSPQGFQAVPAPPVAVPAALSGVPELRTTRDDAFGTTRTVSS